MTTSEAIREVLNAVLAGRDVKKAYLFGSYARGEQLSESDIDLRFLCGDTMTFGQLDEIREELEESLGVKLDIVTASPEQMRPRFYDRIRRDEVLLYEAR